ncbi:MAG: PspC domain-containing protein [Gammaproteobacteria bacterium]|nr:PspC domain-containing protein [Gammaproteobacteria bacterium]MDH5345242.1 PspC domain-containing protein [Gammaproteobacteria bacterium]
MSSCGSLPSRRFYRSRDRALVAGVCAGIADFFGFNLKVTRFLAVISLLVATPVTLIIYFATVLLVPAAPGASARTGFGFDFRRAASADPRQTADDVRRRCQSLDRRLAILERYITSSRYQLDQEFRKL